MLGYIESTIERKAEKRGISADEYRAYLVRQRQTRSVRRTAARAELRAQEQAAKAKRVAK